MHSVKGDELVAFSSSSAETRSIEASSRQITYPAGADIFNAVLWERSLRCRWHSKRQGLDLTIGEVFTPVEVQWRGKRAN